MEKLFRLGHEPARTMGNAKSIESLVRRNDGSLREVSVKALCPFVTSTEGADALTRQKTFQ